MATGLYIDARDRGRGTSEQVMAIPPGPNAHADLEFFLHPIAAQLKELSAEFGGVSVAGSDGTRVIRAHVLLL